MSDPIDGLRAVAASANRRRWVNVVVVLLAVLMAAVNVATIVGVGLLVIHDRHDRAAERKRQRAQTEAGTQVIGDVYGRLNFIGDQLARLTGQAAPPPLVPPSSSTTTVRITAPPRSATTTTTSKPSSPTSTTTAPPSSTTTTSGPPPSTPPSTMCIAVLCIPRPERGH